ncbi:hypothetical protein DIU31_023665 [Mucilaginibacter rubeus]|uniref:Uncharacterized protein n=1 Tax=Mucilaginibacter rubeus TaxID=2027860 RepID=A0AAE6JJ48_9SPHI|nr:MULTISPECIES: hypothetical protein [Mucilaginibacter]QEM06368.1 hypothetical protein DIU31_023665 [Mucilaginibacter rubeus]QEM18951.1 hypothetical protein DIU38_023895 [Mucilaginibacter gossypii]QTE44507.1 hypothetical protein J3L19_03815 [Mucilaginibacter rubeus]QTE51105.1 hypothetical protein J3L21_03790 [Mucilaginibacter rubeus]QTE56191.1 hypothetical protein J3L23_29040 [Mucilaginibacter rubeus]
MIEFVFLNEPDKYFDEGEFIAHLPAVEGEGELLKELSAVLNFQTILGVIGMPFTIVCVIFIG